MVTVSYSRKLLSFWGDEKKKRRGKIYFRAKTIVLGTL